MPLNYLHIWWLQAVNSNYLPVSAGHSIRGSLVGCRQKSGVSHGLHSDGAWLRPGELLLRSLTKPASSCLLSPEEAEVEAAASVPASWDTHSPGLLCPAARALPPSSLWEDAAPECEIRT